MKYPHKFSSVANYTVIVLSDTIVAKLFIHDTRFNICYEVLKIKYAKTINNLVVKFAGLEYN